MPTFTADNRTMWQGLFDSVEAKRPSAGKTVKVVKGRKHVGQAGKVFWHGKDKFYPGRYQSDAQLSLREAMGTFGYRVGIETADGEKFFVSAENVEIVQEA